MQFLVDVNLPKYFNYFSNENFIHVVDINSRFTDQEIWNYALENNLIILTKDTDFYNRFISSERTPKVVYFQVGNLTLSELHIFFKNNWNFIVELLQTANFIIATNQDITIIQ